MKNLFCFIFVLFLSNLARSQNAWELTGGPYDALLYTATISAENVIFLGSYNDLVTRSSDGGATWATSNVDASVGKVTAIAVTKTGKVYAGTDGSGIYCSTDAGVTWTAKNAGLDEKNVIAIATDTAENLVAATINGVFRSLDAGATWKMSLWVYANAIEISAKGTLFLSAPNDAIYSSSDGGDTWKELNNSSLAKNGCSFARGQDGKMFGASSSGLYCTSDEGISWQQCSVDSTYKALGRFTFTSKGEIFAGTHSSGVVVSRDTGKTWSYAGLANKSIEALVANSSGKIFAGSSGNGFYLSSDNGLTWTRLSVNLGMRPLYSFAFKADGTIFAGSYHGGLFRSVNQGDSWTQIDTWTTTYDLVALNVTKKGTVLAWVGGIGLFYSLDNGDSWLKAKLTSDSLGNEVYCIYSDEESNVFIGTRLHGIYRSTDDGASWSSINNGLGNISINSLLKNKAGVLFAGAENSGIFTSTDNGNTWAEKNEGFTINNSGEFNTCLCADSLGNIFEGTYGGGVFRSTDAGEHWAQVNNGLPVDGMIRALVADASGQLYAGMTQSGILRSSDSGESWFPYNTGLTTTFIRALAISPTGAMYVGTDAMGTYSNRKTIGIKETSNVPYTCSLSQNYPNPFNPSTSISYAIVERQFVSLKVFDILGREVVSLVNEEKPAGNYNVKFNASNIPSGVYFYKLQAGSNVQTKKMILLK